MLNVGPPELMVLAVLVLVVVGPERLPGIARKGAQWLARFREEAGQSLSELRAAAEVEDVAKEVSTLRRELRETRAELTRSLGQPLSQARDAVKPVSPGGPAEHGEPAPPAGTDEGAPPTDLEAT